MSEQQVATIFKVGDRVRKKGGYLNATIIELVSESVVRVEQDDHRGNNPENLPFSLRWHIVDLTPSDTPPPDPGYVEPTHAIEHRYGVEIGDDWLAATWAQEKEAEESLPRVFKINGKTITETGAMRELSINEVQGILASTYPEIKSATHNTEVKDGQQVVSFMPRAGRKG